MREVSLAASSRATFGKGPARRSRKEGNIPAVVYGPEISPLPIVLSEKAFRAAVKEASGTSAIINLEVDGKASKVIIRDIQRDPVTSHVVHVDFHAIRMDKALHLSIPVRFVGVARGVKTDGGILQTTMREVDISCLPSDIPEHIDVDVSDLGIGDAIHVRDLSVPNAKILDEPQRTVVVVAAPTVVKVETPEEEAAEELAEGEEAAEAAPEGEAAEGAKPEEKKEDKKEDKKEEKKKE
ncbi:MAG: 50S ribosomal protein L25/general stress protein Ctc [Candidatus Zixiibacteriota bacterium]|nr:MAG: 50S ribosomal protein L25/general stress protein Ctc [candidate division Zixibacteria bacterium]